LALDPALEGGASSVRTMKELIEELERWGADVIFGRAKGFRAALMRFLMRALSGIFRLLVQLRLWRYRSGWKPQHHLCTQVVAVGNITVGGTGKTPVVELLARSLRDRGRKVAILSRGYKSRKLDKPQKWRDSKDRPVSSERMPKVVSTGKALLLDSRHAGDEPFMLAKNLEGVSVVVDKNRVKGGRFAIEHLDANTLLLDDGMQYLDLAHGIDIVLVDSGAPFGT
jgi:tetraacyldisaccharide 4'-kinase